MNEVGSDTYQWHLQQAAILELRAQSQRRRGFYRDADTLRESAEKHRVEAEQLYRQECGDAA